MKRPDSMSGQLQVSIYGLALNVPVVSVGGVFSVKLPTGSGFTTANPLDYGFADPAKLINPTTGLSSLLLKCQSPQVESDDRYNGEALHEIGCTLPGKAVAAAADERRSVQDRRGDLRHRHRHQSAPPRRAHRSVRQRVQHQHHLHARSYQLWRERVSDAAARQRVNTRRRWILAIAAASVLVAAMDTYVIVLALPAIMARRRHRHRPAPGGDPDRQRLPARLRRGHAAARTAVGSLRHGARSCSSASRSSRQGRS